MNRHPGDGLSDFAFTHEQLPEVGINCTSKCYCSINYKVLCTCSLSESKFVHKILQDMHKKLQDMLSVIPDGTLDAKTQTYEVSWESDYGTLACSLLAQLIGKEGYPIKRAVDRHSIWLVNRN